MSVIRIFLFLNYWRHLRRDSWFRIRLIKNSENTIWRSSLTTLRKTKRANLITEIEIERRLLLTQTTIWGDLRDLVQLSKEHHIAQRITYKKLICQNSVLMLQKHKESPVLLFLENWTNIEIIHLSWISCIFNISNPLIRIHVWVSRLMKCYFFAKFCARTKWMIPS